MDNLIPLFLAIQSKDMDTLKSLLETDGDLANSWRFDPIATPLHACVFNPKCAALLLEYGANPNAIDNDDNMVTPVHACSAAGDVETLALLLSHEGDPNARCRWGTPLHLALGIGEAPLPDNHLDVIKLLVDNGADINAPVDAESDQWTPLHQACSEGLSKAVELLIGGGAKVHLGKDGLTPMMVARSMGFQDIVSILEVHGG